MLFFKLIISIALNLYFSGLWINLAHQSKTSPALADWSPAAAHLGSAVTNTRVTSHRWSFETMLFYLLRCQDESLKVDQSRSWVFICSSSGSLFYCVQNTQKNLRKRPKVTVRWVNGAGPVENAVNSWQHTQADTLKLKCILISSDTLYFSALIRKITKL